MRKHTRVMLAALLVVVGVLVFLPSSYVSAGGSVVNSGFEHGEEQEPEGWVLIGNATRVDTEHIYSGNWSDQATGYIYAGNWSAQVTGHGDTLIQWIANITATRAYEAWGWIYVSGNVTG
ncbi:MAG TPA: hypothetical protein VMV76_00225, partial [Dehalococcoidia bacterium]|nr:hypothetical protein [Dehalococcoidia bacterium]